MSSLRGFCFLLVSCGLITSLGLTSPVNAAAGTLTQPSVALPAEYSKAHGDKVYAALRRTDSKFLGGNWLNSFTSLRYSGNTRALGLFLEQLSECPGVSVSVSFFRPGPGQDLESTDWQVAHDAHSNSFNVRINLQSKTVNLEDLYVPPIKK